MDLEDFRREYIAGGLRREQLASDPIEQFETWLKHAISVGLEDPTAMSLATVGPDGRPWQRIVLLKGTDSNGFAFYTNHGSRKAQEIAANAGVCLLFRWGELDRQVIVGGTAEKLPQSSAAKYFATRPRDSQLGAWASHQSRPLSSRAALDASLVEIERRFEDREVPLPPFWGGYRVTPHCMEVWQGRPNRMHDRFMYTRDGDGWSIERLSP